MIPDESATEPYAGDEQTRISIEVRPSPEYTFLLVIFVQVWSERGHNESPTHVRLPYGYAGHLALFQTQKSRMSSAQKDLRREAGV